MKRRSATVTIGALLHDMGKLAHRAGEPGTHSEAGALLLRTIVQDRDILNCIAYHHESALRRAELPADAPVYIVNLADNISAAADRRAEEKGETGGFDRSLALESIFNHLNGGCGNARLPARASEEKLRFPALDVRNEACDYRQILQHVLDGLTKIEFQPEWINSLLALMEAWTSIVPSSTAIGERADISLFDHSRIAAAVAACISEYLEAEDRNDLRLELLDNSVCFYDEQAFLLFSADLSGIQSFIYTVATENALRSLRSRSFYLEILMEHVIDELLDACGLSRANLLYSGGGHCYLLLPNTREAKQAIEDVMQCVRSALIRQFGVQLYLAHAEVACSANDLMNRPAEKAPYQALYRRLSEALSCRKMQRYSAAEIRLLNSEPLSEDGRECRICGTSQQLTGSGLCQWCDRFVRLSRKIQDSDVFVLSLQRDEDALPLPSLHGTAYLHFSDEANARQQLMEQRPVLRIYTKNHGYTGLRYATRLFVGDYHASNLMSELAERAAGIRRLAVLRADVDNLGAAFMCGFEQQSGDAQQRNRFVTLSRTATLSRQLSMFFRYHINGILAGNQPGMEGALPVSIVYSGGDDLFLLGAWDGVIQAMLRIQEAFESFTSGRLHLSAGVGIYGESYPIRRAAIQTEELVDEAKSMEGKNAVSLFAPGQGHSYSWSVFRERVIGEKLSCVRSFFKNQARDGAEERGMAFLYRILELLRRCNEQINLARIAYLLARLEPSRKETEAQLRYRVFSRSVMQWCRSEEDRRELITAIYLYVYRERGANVNDSESLLQQ